MYTFGFVGAGNMGSALIKATAEKFPKRKIAVFDKHPEKLNKISSISTILNSAKDVVKNSKFLFVGVKPQAYETLFNEIKNELANREDVVIVSMAAGISISGVEKYCGKKLKVIRIMPNTPCQIGQGVVLYACNELVSDEEKNIFLKATKACGFVDEIDEEKIDVASALSGCGPAFVYMYINALKEGAVKCGLDEEKALKYAIKTVEGSAKMLESSTLSVSELIKAVCSPGGTTIEGVKSFEKDDLNAVCERAITASYNRTLELKK